MANNPNETLCVQCGKRGFKRITKQYNNNLTVPALECIHCSAILYEHEAMLMIEAEREQSVTRETI